MKGNPQHFLRVGARYRALRRRHQRVFVPLVGAIVLLVVAGLAGATWFWTGLLQALPGDEAIGRVGQMAQATAIFDRSDRLVFTLHKEQRTDVPLSTMSPHLISAVLAIEDQRFYQHHGFDPIRMIGAALANLRAGRTAQGGSTITQQLARQSFLSLNKTYRRKLQELILAARLERRYSKDKILEFYLNKVYLGDGLYGVEAASRGYFGKHASDLSLPEAAVLAGLIRSPSNDAPTLDLERATERRNVVLRAMLEAGSIDADTFEAARDTYVELSDALRVDEGLGQYFKEEVRQYLVSLFGIDRVYEGGLRVYSTIDPVMQEAAEAVVAEGLRRLDARREAAARRSRHFADQLGDGPLEAALIAMDPATGHVRAMVGGRDFAQTKFNRAVQARRQPGSAFKPFVYAAALEAGFTPATVIDGLNEPIPTFEGDWTPEDGHSEADSMSLRTALTTSSNRAAVHLLQRVGIAPIVQFARNLGVGNVPSVPSLALGSGEVTLQSLTAAYAAFGNHGRVPMPMLVRRVEDSEGQVLYETKEMSSPAIDDTTAFLLSTMLADVIDHGTGYGARQVGFSLPAAGKTGTTNDYHDAWFIGFTPHLAAGVWVGLDQPRTILPNGFAGDVAVPLWGEFMKVATKGDEPEWLTRPDDVTVATVCRLSGLLASEGCDHVEVVGSSGVLERRSMVYTEYFASGTEPTSLCNLHPTRGFFGTLAAALTGREGPAPPRLEDTGVVVHSTVHASRVVDPLGDTLEPEPPPAPKRGFWSRLFSRADDDDRPSSRSRTRGRAR